MLFEKFNIPLSVKSFIEGNTTWTYDDIFNCVDRYYTNKERSMDEIEYYISTIEDLQKNGGKIYRLVFLYNIRTLKTDKLGVHWCIDKYTIDNFYSCLESDVYGYESVDDEQYYEKGFEKKPYLITATIPPNFLDIKSSIGQFTSLPNELEVNLLFNPEKYTIKKYNRF